MGLPGSLLSVVTALMPAALMVPICAVPGAFVPLGTKLTAVAGIAVTDGAGFFLFPARRVLLVAVLPAAVVIGAVIAATGRASGGGCCLAPALHFG